jgi:hypothetical protein
MTLTKRKEIKRIETKKKIYCKLELNDEIKNQ